MTFDCSSAAPLASASASACIASIHPSLAPCTAAAVSVSSLPHATQGQAQQPAVQHTSERAARLLVVSRRPRPRPEHHRTGPHASPDSLRPARRIVSVSYPIPTQQLSSTLPILSIRHFDYSTSLSTPTPVLHGACPLFSYPHTHVYVLTPLCCRTMQCHVSTYTYVRAGHHLPPRACARRVRRSSTESSLGGTATTEACMHAFTPSHGRICYRHLHVHLVLLYRVELKQGKSTQRSTGRLIWGGQPVPTSSDMISVCAPSF